MFYYYLEFYLQIKILSRKNKEGITKWKFLEKYFCTCQIHDLTKKSDKKTTSTKAGEVKIGKKKSNNSNDNSESLDYFD